MATAAASVAALEVAPGSSAPLREIPRLPLEEFRERVLSVLGDGGRAAALFAAPWFDGRSHLVAALAPAAGERLLLLSTPAPERFPSLTPEAPQLHLFERELAEEKATAVQGHPWLKPVRYCSACGGSAPSSPPPTPGGGDFFRVEGEEVHEVAVGPVHAGVIEPGHFRFQCHGEHVLHLEIALGYQHRGAEKALVGGPSARSLSVAETAAGDTTAAHAWAYAQVVEGLAGVRPDARVDALRAAALELERMANHAGDLGALAGDIGFLPGASYLGRLRGDILNLTTEICGSRLGRGLTVPGGVRYGVPAALGDRLCAAVDHAAQESKDTCALMWDAPSVMQRFEGTATVSRSDAQALGLVGLAARASGLARDARAEFPRGPWLEAPHVPAVGARGDVLARARVRAAEIQASARMVPLFLNAGPAEAVRAPTGPLAPFSLAVGIAEGWRGEAVHVGVTGADGRFARYKIVDPSFHNWAGLALSMRGQPISDFPLANKSFNLSYCGHDL